MKQINKDKDDRDVDNVDQVAKNRDAVENLEYVEILI